MDDSLFWALISKMDWQKVGDDDAVCAPLVEALVERTKEEIEGFEEVLSQKLYALDTEAHARQIGLGGCGDDSDYFSPDGFLYARCCVVVNGQAAYEAILNDPSEMPKDMDFEPILYVAGEAYEEKTGEEFEFDASVSYESGSNAAGWA